MSPTSPAPLLYQSTHSVKLGQSARFEINYSPFDSAQHYASSHPRTLWVRIRNTEPIPFRAAYLAGPYALYVDCRQRDYSTTTRAFVTADQPVFEPQLQPGQTFYAELSCHTFQEQYCWTVDVISQIIFNNSIGVHFEVCIAEEREMSDYMVPEQNLQVTVHDTLDLWNLPLPDTSRPVHLVILTHGLHSNVSADMLFLKEQIDSGAENVVVKGFFGNVCKTERGVKYLGSKVAEYVVELVRGASIQNVTKISFIGHSLGGLVQTFAIAYIEANYPWFFESIQPINFVTLASPMLGVIHENPAYVKLALSAGIVGRTGQDLGLQYMEKDQKPLLLLLPSGPTHRILRRFVRRTAYANAFNDGIVPLRTSALLYLDYQGLSSVLHANGAKSSDSNKANGGSSKLSEDSIDMDTDRAEQSMSGKIPHELPEQENADTSFSPVSAMLSYFFPQKQKPKGNPFQTKQEDSNVEGALTVIPKTSMLESAASLILPPPPSMKYITDPDSRENVILHDKVYHESDLPKYTKEPKTREETERKKGMIEMLQSKGEEFRQLVQGYTESLEEDIAREYHKSMSWRKVLVNLKPDAHNNIVVRRRFANSYGWPVIDHLVKNHFCVDDDGDLDMDSENTHEASDDEVALTRILSKDLIKKENEKLDSAPSEENCEHAWINSQESGQFFVGPAGLLSDFSDMVFNLKDQLSSYGTKADIEETKLDDDPPEEKVMGGFI